MGKGTEKFSFGIEFQENLLQYTVTDNNGHKVLQLYEDWYFTLLEHQIIAFALKKYFKKNQRVPKNEVVLQEELRVAFTHRDYTGFTEEDKKRVYIILGKIYKGPIRDGDDIFQACIQFRRYVETKECIEKVDLTDFSKYEEFSTDIRKAITAGDQFKVKRSTLLVSDIRSRQMDRHNSMEIVPTPFWQINKSTNVSGYPRHSIMVLLDKEKKFKTGMLVNLTRGYMRMKKRVLYIDIENGHISIATRLEQSLSNKTKKEIFSGEYDDKVQKILRKYRRMGVEVSVKRVPAGSNCNFIQALIDDDYREYGIRYNILMVDYAALMGSNAGDTDDFQRISNAYTDLKTLLEHNDIEHCWTANHIVREAFKREKTKYDPQDIAKCIDIARHADAIWGLNRNDEELKNGVVRMELVEQRDGDPQARCFFWANIQHQRADEFNKEQVKMYYEEHGDIQEPKTYQKDL